LTSALSYVPNSKKLRSAIGFRDKAAMLFNVTVLFLAYPFYHTTRLRRVPQVLYKILRDYHVEADGILFLMPGNCPVESTLINKDYEPEVRNVVRGFKEGVFVDCGAALGLYTLISSKTMGDKGKVISIEPDPLMFSHLWTNIDANKCYNVRAYKNAAWSSKTTMKLYSNYLTRFASSVMEGSKPNKYSDHFDQVQTVVLDDIIPEGSPLLMKVDVEGAEPEVFKGAKKNLMRSDCSVIFEALNFEALARCKAILEPMGYTVNRLSEKGREEENDFLAIKRGRNFVATKQS
jgi:FkbM family methyltransferase